MSVPAASRRYASSTWSKVNSSTWLTIRPGPGQGDHLLRVGDRRALERVDLAVGGQRPEPRAAAAGRRPSRPARTRRPAGPTRRRRRWSRRCPRSRAPRPRRAPLGQVPQPALVVVVHSGHGLVRAERVGVGEAVLGRVDGDHLGGGQHPQELHRERAQTARAEHHGRPARVDPRQRPAHRVVGRGARVGQRAGVPRVEPAQRQQAAHAGDQHVVGEAAVAPVTAPGAPVRAGVVQAAHAGPAGAAGRGGDQRDRVALGHAAHAGAQRGHPARRLVAQR